MLTITVQGEAHSGKGHLMALLAHWLRETNLNVELQGEDTHLAQKMRTPASEHCANLQCRKDLRIRILEQQTAL